MTREEAAKAAEVMKAYSEGKKIEWRARANAGWFLLGDDAVFDWGKHDYRIAKGPVLVPWESEADVPWNCWVKRKDGGDGRWHVSGVSEVAGSVATSVGQISFRRLLDEFVWSTDGKTWNPCGKVK